MYTISRRIFAVWIVNFLQIQTFRTYSVHNFPQNFRSYGNQFFFKSKHSVCTISEFSVEFKEFWTFNFSANPDVSYVYNIHNFPLNFPSLGYSIFLQIQKFRTENVHNFPLNLRSYGNQFFFKSKHSVRIVY